MIAAQAGWRKDMIGIADWLAAEIDRLGVEVHLNRYVETRDIIAEQPDVGIVASGGIPLRELPEGGGATGSRTSRFVWRERTVTTAFGNRW